MAGSNEHLAGGTQTIADLGSWEGDVRARTVRDRHPLDGPLRRPSQPLAARHEREHERTAPTVLPEGHRPLTLEPGRPRRRRARAEHATPKATRLANPSSGPGRAPTLAATRSEARREWKEGVNTCKSRGSPALLN